MLWKRLAVLVAAAMIVLSMFAASAPAFAEQGGTPNENACSGQTLSILNRAGYTPPEVTKRLRYPNPGVFNDENRRGDIEVFLNAGGAPVGCSWAHVMHSQAEFREALKEEEPIHHGNQEPGAFK